MAQRVFQLLLKPDQLEQGHRPIKLDQQIQIASRVIFAPGYRSKDA